MKDEPQQKPNPSPEPENEDTKAPEAPAVPESQAPDESSEPVEEPAPPARKQRLSKEALAMRNLWIVIGGLALLLMISLLTRQWQPRSASTRALADDAEVAAIKADLEERRAELNRQRAELDLPPLSGRSDRAGDITARLRKDADTLVSLVERYQQLVAEKDREITEKNVEIIRSEQRREALAAELEEARGMPRESNDGRSAQLEEELAAALTRSNQLADQLTEARRSLAELEASPPSDEVDILNRRLDEAKRARDFFEQRAAQLERRLEGGDDGENGEEDQATEDIQVIEDIEGEP